MEKRLQHTLAAFIIAQLFCAACSTPPAPPTPAPTATARPVPTSTRPLPTPTPEPERVDLTATPTATAAPRALLVWAVGPEASRDALQRLIADTARAEGVAVTVISKSPDALSADIQGGSLAGLPAPDLIWGSEDDLFFLLRTGTIQPVSDGLDESDFLPAVIEGATAAGERWGTPVAAHDFLLLLYNKKLTTTAPATTDELIARARTLTGRGRYGLVAGWIEPRWLEAWLYGFNGSSLDSNQAPMLDTLPMIAALDLLKELRGTGPPPPSTYAEGADLFQEGQVAFAIDGEWSLSSYREYTETLDLGIAPLPRVPATGRAAVAPLGGIYVMYGATLGAGELEVAHRLAVAFTTPVTQGRIARDLRHLPALRIALRDTAVVRDPALAAAATNALDAPGLPPIKELRCAWEAVETVLPSLLLGEETQEEAAQRMQERAEACER